MVRIMSPWVENMKAIGIDASVRLVDSSQYEERQRNFDFDLNTLAVSVGATPSADALETLYHSRAADRPGTRNYPGTKARRSTRWWPPPAARKAATNWSSR